MPTNGFWSYVRDDDAAESGRIRELAGDLAAQYEAITADTVEIFLDKTSLGWGDDWAAAIESAVLGTSFFIPILSPRCRRELRLFTQKASGLGLSELIMPLLWFDVPQLHQEESGDDLVEIVKKYQWEDWTSLRFEERSSGTYKRAVHGLAQQLVGRAAALAPSAVVEARVSDVEHVPDEPGELDRVAAGEVAMSSWLSTLESIQEEIVAIGEVTDGVTPELNAANARKNPAGAKLTILRHYKSALEPHVERVDTLANQFTSELYDIDGAVRTVFAEAERGALSQEDEAQFGEFCASIRGMAASSRDGLGSLAGLVRSIQPVESMSRDLRPTLVRLRRGLTQLMEAQDVIDGWDALAIAASGDEPTA